jgi:hypothetical protein
MTIKSCPDGRDKGMFGGLILMWHMLCNRYKNVSHLKFGNLRENIFMR